MKIINSLFKNKRAVSKPVMYAVIVIAIIAVAAIVLALTSSKVKVETTTAYSGNASAVWNGVFDAKEAGSILDATMTNSTVTLDGVINVPTDGTFPEGTSTFAIKFIYDGEGSISGEFEVSLIFQFDGKNTTETYTVNFTDL